MVRNNSHGFSLPKMAGFLAAIAIAAGLALTAPGHAAAPSTAAARLVDARHHKRPGHHFLLWRLGLERGQARR